MYRRWSVFLPIEANYAIVDFLNAYTVVAQHPESSLHDERSNRIDDFDPERVLGEALLAVFNAAREDLRVEALSKERSELIAQVTGHEEQSIDWENRKPPNPAA